VGRLFPAAPDFIHGPELGDRVNAKALAESLVHGIKYAFPPEKEGMTRGMPTASAAEPLSRKMTHEDPVPVRPFEQGPHAGLCVSAALQESATSGAEGPRTLVTCASRRPAR
jgi:hypothetical protein